MLRLDQIAQAFGKVKKVDAVVAHRQLLHGLERDRLDEPGSNIQNEKFDLQFVLDKTNAPHSAPPRVNLQRSYHKMTANTTKSCRYQSVKNYI